MSGRILKATSDTKLDTPFSSRKFITSNKDLQHYTRHLPKSYYLLDKGNNIKHYDDLMSINPNSIKNKRLAIIINTLSHKPTKNRSNIGHWILLVKEKNGHCLLFDSLGTTYDTQKKIKNSINQFCFINHLRLVIWRLKTQMPSSQCCGFAVIYFLHIFSKYGIKKMLFLKKELSSFSVYQREHFILTKTYSLCKKFF